MSTDKNIEYVLELTESEADTVLNALAFYELEGSAEKVGGDDEMARSDRIFQALHDVFEGNTL